MATQTVLPPSAAKNAKRSFRRATPSNAQRVRHAVQLFFVVLNVWLGAQFYLWVRFYERGGAGLQVPRPAGAEGWLPIAGLMNFKFLVTTGQIPIIHPAAMFLFMAFVGMSLLAKKSFCSWICPVGTFSEVLAGIGKKIFRSNLRVHRWIDIPLRGLKYLLLGFFVFIIGTMSAEAIAEFMQTPYGIIADVKMLNFFRGMSGTAAVVIAALVLLSIVIENFWCRYLCPYGALMGLVSLLSPLKIRRNATACIDCGKCARACPAALAVDKLVQIRSVECTACMQCVSSCPVEGALQLGLTPGLGEAVDPSLTQPWYRLPMTPLAMVAVLAGLFFGMILFARATGHWQTNLPSHVYQELVPHANDAAHPGY